MRLHNENEVPPGCFFYVVPETGMRVPGSGTTSLNGCYRLVCENLRGNGYSIPGGLREKIEEFCCQQTVPGRCQEDRRMQPEVGVSGGSFSMALSRIMQGTKSIASWWTEGVEDEATCIRRANVCKSCPENQPIDKATCRGCQAAALNRFIQFVDGVMKGRRVEDWENGLEACRICGCSLRMKIRTKLDPIRRYMSKEQLGALPPSCWINTERGTE